MDEPDPYDNEKDFKKFKNLKYIVNFIIYVGK